MINNSYTSNINFNGRLNFLNTNKFDKICDLEALYNKGKFAYGEFQAKDSVIADECATAHIADCVSLSFMDKDKAFVQHIIPNWGVEHFNEVEEVVKKALEKIQIESSLLIGGFNNFRESKILQEKFLALMKKLNIDCSVFLGQKNTGNSIIAVHANPSKQEWNINIQSADFDRLTLKEKNTLGYFAKNNYSPETAEEVKNYFNNVKISMNDVLHVE